MTCRALWSTISDESLRSDVLFKIDFMYLTKEFENKDAECIFNNEKIFEDERGEN